MPSFTNNVKTIDRGEKFPGTHVEQINTKDSLTQEKGTSPAHTQTLDNGLGGMGNSGNSDHSFNLAKESMPSADRDAHHRERSTDNVFAKREQDHQQSHDVSHDHDR